MIKSTKRYLKKSLKNARLTYEELKTTLTEVEAVLNSRPHTYIYEDETVKVITPSHLIMGKRLLTPAVDEKNLNEEAYDMKKDEARKRVKYMSLLRDKFWNRLK